jgi:DNA repair exonuclease SbcCD ATPase subunit
MANTETEIAIDQPAQKVMSGFAKRNANKERIEREENELKELLSLQKNPEEDVEDTTEEVLDETTEELTGYEKEEAERIAEREKRNKNLSKEEKTFKKRYGDLRRHSQKKEQELQTQIDELRQQLEASTKKEIKYPKSEDELSAWMEKYPDVAKIVETIAMKKANEQAETYESKFKEIDEMRLEAQREKAEAELMRLHPDFGEIRDSNEFHKWVEAQPKWIQDALYDNDSDATSASRAIDLYKADMGIKPSKASNEKDAAKAVKTKSERNSPDKSTDNGKILESTVMKMSTLEYERHADEIAEAIRTGKFVYDVSGSAR